MKIPLAGLLVVTTVMGIAPEAAAEERLRPLTPVFSQNRLAPFVQQALDQRAGQRQAPDGVVRSPRRDSIWNGALIGAAIGGLGGSALIVASHGGSDNIPRAMLNVCAPPALAGFAVGAIVDALR